MAGNRKQSTRYRKKVVVSTDDVLISQRAAQRVMGDPAFLAALDEIEAAYFDRWGDTTPQETAKREVAYYGLKAVRDVRAILQTKANSASVRDKKDQIARDAEPKCPGCGVTDNELHKAECQILANRLRTQKLANG